MAIFAKTWLEEGLFVSVSTVVCLLMPCRDPEVRGCQLALDKLDPLSTQTDGSPVGQVSWNLASMGTQSVKPSDESLAPHSNSITTAT